MRTLSLACCAYDRTRPLVDGRVKFPGCDIRPFLLSLDEILRRAYGGAEFDVVELGLGSYVQHAARGDCPYVALPAFPLRAFRHRAIYVRCDRIAAPEDLADKRVGVVDYGMTAAVVLRGILRERHGVDTASIRWVVGGMEAPFPGRPEHPSDRRVETAPVGATLSGLLAAGAIDAVIALSPPSCFVEGNPAIARLFPDYRAAEAAFFRATEIFPIMHLIAIRRSLAEESGLAQAVYATFAAAKDYAMAELGVTQAPKTTLPWVVAAYEETRALLGPDYWPYGIRRNRALLTAFLRQAHADHLTPRDLDVDALFHRDTLDS